MKPCQRLALAFVAVALMGADIALANATDGFDLRLSNLTRGKFDLFQPAIPLSLALMAITVYAAIISVLHIRARKSWNEQFEEQSRSLRESQAKLERSAIFLETGRQVLLAWGAPNGEIESSRPLLP